MNTVLGSNTTRLIRSSVLGALLLLGACAQTPGISPASEAIFYPPLPQKPRVQFLTTIANELSLGEVESGGFREFVVGAEKRTYLALGRPIALAHTPGYLYVLDRAKKAPIAIDLETGKFTVIADFRSGPVASPVSLTVDQDWRVYVVDQGRSEVIVYNDRDEFEQSYSTGEGKKPIDVLVLDDRLVISELSQNEILVLDKATGEVFDRFGGIGSDEGLVNKPTNLALTHNGNIAVVDTLNNRVQVLDQDGNFVEAFGTIGRNLGSMIRPKGIDVDRNGYLYVPDAGFEFVTIWEMSTGVPVLTFGLTGKPGGLYLPNDVDIDYDNVKYFQKFAHPQFRLEYVIYVSNALDSVNVYGFGSWEGSLRAPRRSEGRAADSQQKETKNAPSALEDISSEP